MHSMYNMLTAYTEDSAVITAKLRKTGNSYVVTIPREEIERQQLREGQLLAVEVRPVEIRPTLAPDLAESVERVWRDNEPGLRYLAGR